MLGLFFTAVGMLFDPVTALASWSGILLFVLAVVILKTGIIVLVLAAVLRQGLRIGILTGLGLAQTGEFSFVLAEAASPGLLDDSMLQIFVAGSLLTLIATPFLFQGAPHLARLLLGGGGRGARGGPRGGGGPVREGGAEPGRGGGRRGTRRGRSRR